MGTPVDSRDQEVKRLREELQELQRLRGALEESESRLRQIIDLVPHMIFAKDETGRFLLVNRALAEAYGTEVDQLIGRRQAEVHGIKTELQDFLRGDRSWVHRPPTPPRGSRPAPPSRWVRGSPDGCGSWRGFRGSRRVHG